MFLSLELDIIPVGNEVALAVLGAVIYVVGEKGARFLIRRWKTSPTRRFWAPWLKHDALLICATAGAREPGRTRGTGAMDCLALQAINSRLAEVSPGTTPRPVMEQGSDDYIEADFVTIGGPATNHVTDLILNDPHVMGLVYRFKRNENVIETTAGLEVRRPNRPGEKEFTSDSGLICHLPHPFKKGGHVLVIAGCWGQGTFAGAELLLEQVDELLKRSKGGFFQVVFDVAVDANQRPVRPRIDWGTLVAVDVVLAPESWKRTPRSIPPSLHGSVSVVIPCRNEESTVRRVVETFVRHAAVREVIVVDNGSIDGTRARATEGGGTVVEEPREGKGFALAAGIRQSRGKLVFLIDGDIENPDGGWLDELLHLHHSGKHDVVRGDPPYYPPVVWSCIRPLLRIYFPASAEVGQPIGGIVLLKSQVAKELEWYTGWGVDIGLTIQTFKRGHSYAEAKIGPLAHADRPEYHIAEMSGEIVATILAEAGRLDGGPHPSTITLR